MLHKILSLTLVALVLNITVAARPVDAETHEEKDARRVEKVKEGVRRRGIGEKARVKVQMLDKTTVKGYIKEVTADNFVVVDARTNAASTIDYRQVKAIGGRNLSTWAKIDIGVGIAGAVLATLIVIALTQVE